MSYLYDDYLKEHVKNVNAAWMWMLDHLDIDEYWANTMYHTMQNHDSSKYRAEEYDAYDSYFYGGNRSSKVVRDFNRAWLHHIHHNPHHWQHWILVNDDEGEQILEMPINYVFEMIADWWSFSFGKGNLCEIFSWYEDHKEKMKLHPNTRRTVENILKEIKTELNKEEGNHE